MSAILTLEEKKYLRRICRYLGSLGMTEGNLEFEVENSDFDCEGINWKEMTHFSNNYRAEIPDDLRTIFQKCFQHLCDKNLIESPDVDDVNYERLEITIHCQEREIAITHYYSYYDRGQEEGVSYSLADYGDDDVLKSVFKSLDEMKIKEKNLRLDYYGSGDSGYLEGNFSSGHMVPAEVEDYCYRMLENNFGGWEINEGSQGYFLIDRKNKVIELLHTSNIEESESDTLWEETF